MLAVLLAARRPPAPRWVGELLRWAEAMQPWSMIEVMMLGILVALIKIAELATVEPGIGMYAVGALVVLLAGDRGQLRSARGLEAGPVGRTGSPPTARPADGVTDGGGAMTTGALDRRAGGTGLVRGLRPAVAARRCRSEPGYCPRCGEELEFAPPRRRSSAPGRS